MPPAVESAGKELPAADARGVKVTYRRPFMAAEVDVAAQRNRYAAEIIVVVIVDYRIID